MRGFLRLLALNIVLIITFPVVGQVTEDFSDGDFTANPTWSGDDASWTIESGRLKSNNTSVNSTFFLSTPNTLINGARWEFAFELNFATSGSNYLDFWIVSTEQNLVNSLNGYFVRIGGTPDEISLFKRTAGTDAKIIDGADGMVPTNSSGKVIVTRTSGGAFQLIQKGVSAADSLVGSVADNSFQSTTHIGVVIKQSVASFFQRHFLDDIKVSAFGGPDLIPPSLVSADLQISTAVDMVFNEPVDDAFCSNLALYSIDPVVTIVSANRVASDISRIRLVFSNDLPPGNYTVTVSQSKDTSGNIQTTAQSKSFTFAPVVPVGYRSVVINEIMAAPSNSAGTVGPHVEWIELFNPTDLPISMNGWTIQDATTAPKVLPNLVLPAGGYAIIASAANAALFPIGVPVLQVSPPSLNNDKDSLVLADANGFAVDIVRYFDTWYLDPVKKAGGYTLEQINPFLQCSGASNWVGANFPDGSSAGTQNTAFSNVPDLTPPQLVQFDLVSLTQVSLLFNEFLRDTTLNIANFSIEGLTISQVQNRTPSADRITLILATPMVPGNRYNLTITGLKDCQGNLAGTIQIKIGKGKTPAKYELLISEIQSDDSPENQLPQAEYVEIYNPTGLTLELKGVQFSDATSTATIPSGLIGPGEYVILCATSNASKFTGLQAIGLSSWPSLNSEGDNLTLSGSTGIWLHQMFYKSSDFSPYSLLVAGNSLEMIDAANPCDQLGNWAISTSINGGTPGLPNSVKGTHQDSKAPVLIKTVVLDSNTVKCKWDELIDSTSLANVAITILPDSFTVSSRTFSSADYSSLTIGLSKKIQPNQSILITVGIVSDCAGNASSPSASTIGRAAPADSTSWTLNEILFDPKTGGVDYVELKNSTAKYLDLKEISIANKDDSRAIVSEVTVIAPGGFALLTSSKPLSLRDYPRGKVENFIQTTLPSFNSDSGTVRIVGPGFKTWEKFFFSDKFHAQILDDTKGVSLERISGTLPSNDPASWQSASSDAGYGTPGYENSQDRNIGTGTDFKAEPKTFSPNGDGNKDFTILTYDQSKKGLIGNLRIYSADGFLIRNLAESTNLGSQGFWKWDGITDDGNKARMGLYMAVLETTELGGDTKYYKIPVAIATDR